uniref:Reverse transcriptase domain-containing protein n=1 Tax=Lactuca sativa TaxID=4236 RepID=A0A9R1UJ94_LACSA|nr:hypothetical protein LSAT_V11C900489130 [Lactuca sativa]
MKCAHGQKKSKEKMLLFKVDFNKAFDSVNWEFGMGRGKWRGWIQSCLKIPTLSVLLNGSPTKEFGMGRGIRQGDPLYPLLFLIAIEGLHIVMEEACAKGIFRGMRIPNSDLCISHLLYADDALFVGEWSDDNIKNLTRILRCFHVSSGLKVNFNKSRIFGISVDRQEVTSLVEPLGCVIKKLESIRRRFLWGGTNEHKKINWVSWQSVTAPKEIGGLGMGSLRALNLSLITKWIWRLKVDNSGLWSKISEINMLTTTVRDFQLMNGRDKWMCTLSSDGVFYVDALRLKIDCWNMPLVETPLRWIHEITLKVTCFMWRANLDRIPTACALLKRGIQLESPLCTYCENEEEDASHVILRCPMVVQVWEWVFRWCDISNVQFGSVEELLKFSTQWGTCAKKRKSLISICYGTAWLIWKARCDWFFKKSRISPVKVADLVKSTVFS